MIRMSAVVFIHEHCPALDVKADATDSILESLADVMVNAAPAVGAEVTRPDALATLVTLRAMARGF